MTLSIRFAIGSEMSGSVFNVTVDGCQFGVPGSDYSGVHLKSMRGRGGSIHDVWIKNSLFLATDSLEKPFPISASLYYSGNPPPTNASATPHMHSVTFSNLTIHLPAQSTKTKDPPAAITWIGLPESLMTNFTFRDIAVLPTPSGMYPKVQGWACTNVSGFVFDNVTPPPDGASHCLET